MRGSSPRMAGCKSHTSRRLKKRQPFEQMHVLLVLQERTVQFVARMERSAIRDDYFSIRGSPDFDSLHPGYGYAKSFSAHSQNKSDGTGNTLEHRIALIVVGSGNAIPRR